MGFTDSLPTGVVVSTPSVISGSCGGGIITATAGSGVVTLLGATLAASGSCNFSVSVTGTTAGLKLNTTSAVTSNEGGSGLTAQAPLVVVAPAVIAKAFGVPAVPVNGTTSLTFTITNPAVNTVPQTGVAFVDALPTGMTVAASPALGTNCGGTATATPGSTTVSLTGGTIPLAGGCTLSVNVTAATSGVYSNITGTVSSTQGGTGNTASASLMVAAPPAITQAFGAATLPLNATTSLTFTLANPAVNTIALTGVA
ncbi:MAG TPA: hypothetical protein VMR62_15245, partial [Bryobacteraceae bacterium]|nr:hypothetical protein [Bryobacteraceae bacterium]